MSQIDNKIPINILVGDRTYRVKIKKDNEELVRKTIKLVNDRILDFKTNFHGKDMQDYISMALIWFASEQNITGDILLKEKETNSKISKMEQLLDKYLEENEEQ